jgi:hypothetical protein
MAKRPKTAPVSSQWDTEVRLLAWLALCVSVFSFLFYFQRGQVLLYGDAVAHMNIARRVFDSKTPGLLQLGTVWLPLPHLVMIPFLFSDEMWRRGVGGSMPSLIAYVMGVVGMFRLMRGTLSRTKQLDASAHVAAWAAAIVYAANPNLIYMQTTAMGEALYLAFFIWAVVYFSESVRGDAKALTKCGLCLAAACLTRYDGWFLAVGMVAAAVLLTLFPSPAKNPSVFSRAAVTKFVLLAAASPILWLAYNGIVYRNPLEFENGPYSAKAIERRTQTAGNPGHPGSGNLVVAGLYFVKSGEANVSEYQWLQRAWILILLIAVVATVLAHRKPPAAATSASPAPWPLAFLLVPLLFYALSVAYGGVPIFVPAWWPFTHYNVRYGLQLLPAFAAAVALVIDFVLRLEAWNWRLRLASVLGVFALVGVSYVSVWSAVPVSLQEAQVNMGSRNHLEAQLAGWLQKLPADSTLLMYLGDHVGAVQQAGIPFKRVINEGNHRVWMHPQDPEGLWESALTDPAKYADYVVAFEGDSVWQAVQGRHLKELVELHTTGQPRAILYRAR